MANAKRINSALQRTERAQVWLALRKLHMLRFEAVRQTKGMTSRGFAVVQSVAHL